jgi:pimeloyl-ACP methyl ester carboxylesterase
VANQAIRGVITPIDGDSTGPALVLFLAGLTGNMSQWDLVLPRLRSLPADLAYGAPILPHPVFEGTKPTITGLANALCEELRCENRQEVVVVAHSVGAFVALAVARLLPDVIKEVILINGGLTSVARFLDNPVRELVSRPRTCLSALRLFALVATPAPSVVKRAIVKSEKSSRVLLGGLVSNAALDSEEQRRSLVETAGKPEVLRALWDNRHYWQEFLGYARQVQPRVLFLIGDQDPMSGERDTEAMAGLLRNARIRILPGVGHAAPLETADAVAAAIRESVAAPVA